MDLHDLALLPAPHKRAELAERQLPDPEGVDAPPAGEPEELGTEAPADSAGAVGAGVGMVEGKSRASTLLQVRISLTERTAA